MYKILTNYELVCYYNNAKQEKMTKNDNINKLKTKFK